MGLRQRDRNLFYYLVVALSLAGSVGLFAHEGEPEAGQKSSKVKQQDKKEHYTCAMHPEVHADKPGKCPICGMNLTKVGAEKDSHKGMH